MKPATFRKPELPRAGQMTLPPPPEPRGQLNLPEFRTNQHSELQGAESRGDLAHWSSHGYLAKEPEQNDSGKIMEILWSLRTCCAGLF